MNRLCALFGVTALLVLPWKGLSQEGNCTQRDNSSRPDCPGAIIFLGSLQAALQSNDHKAVASLVRYPLLATSHSKKVSIASPAQLLTHYDEIFDAGIRCTVLNASAKEVWGNWQGFAVGNGAIWFDGVLPRTEKVNIDSPDYWTKHPFKIITVNNGSAPVPCKSK